MDVKANEKTQTVNLVIHFTGKSVNVDQIELTLKEFARNVENNTWMQTDKENKNMIKIEWNQEKKDRVAEMIEEWLIEHDASDGETIAQNDECQIDAPNLIGDLCDEIIKPEWTEDE